MLIAVVGASGFVGSAVSQAVVAAGHEIRRVKAPRLAVDGAGSEAAAVALRGELQGVDVVVNCAGNPDASASRSEQVTAPNAVLPGVIGAAAMQAGVHRFVHVSSAVVQGRRPMLDSSDATDEFSVYAASKAEGERAARSRGPAETVVYRPPSVHAPCRRVTRQLTRIARSPLSSVAAPGDRPTPQTHIDDVASAVLFLATSASSPPSVVHHPWQGHTTADLLTLLGGGHPPKRLPHTFARRLVAAGVGASRVLRRLAPYVRRAEMVWFGQRQAESWLTRQGWRPRTTATDWTQLGENALVTRHPTGDSA